MPLQNGDTVYALRSLLELSQHDASPFYKTTVVRRRDRSVSVSLPDGSASKLIATKKLHTRLGVLIVQIGDFAEETLIDPLSRSILQYCRMLLPEDSVRLIRVRSTIELRHYWRELHALYESVILIGHGSQTGYQFGNDAVTVTEMKSVFVDQVSGGQEFISLGCQTGFASFAKEFSTGRHVKAFMAPFHSVHGCAAALFTQTYLHERLLANLSAKVAFNHARSDLREAVSFRMWRDGKLKAGAS